MKPGLYALQIPQTQSGQYFQKELIQFWFIKSNAHLNFSILGSLLQLDSFWNVLIYFLISFDIIFYWTHAELKTINPLKFVNRI